MTFWCRFNCSYCSLQYVLTICTQIHNFKRTWYCFNTITLNHRSYHQPGIECVQTIKKTTNHMKTHQVPFLPAASMDEQSMQTSASCWNGICKYKTYSAHSSTCLFCSVRDKRPTWCKCWRVWLYHSLHKYDITMLSFNAEKNVARFSLWQKW